MLYQIAYHHKNATAGVLYKDIILLMFRQVNTPQKYMHVAVVYVTNSVNSNKLR